LPLDFLPDRSLLDLLQRQFNPIHRWQTLWRDS
jgi:hypothetical protein